MQTDNVLQTVAAGHELFHWLKRQDADSANYLQKLVIQTMKNDKNINFEEIYNQRAEKYSELTEDEILEEIAAQYFGVVFSSEDNIRKAVNEANDTEKSILKKIIGRLKQFIANVKATLREYAVKDKTVEAALNAEVKELEDMARMFDAMLTEAGKNKKPATDEGGVKYSRRLKDSDLSGYLNAGQRQNKNKAAALEKGHKIILTSQEEITDYINNSVDKKHNGVTVAYGIVNSRLTEDVREISAGKIDIKDYYLEFVPFDLQHAFEQHHIAKEKGDVDLSREDFENIPEYFDNYDELLYARRYSSGNTRICVSKKISNGRMLIIETVSKSRGAMQFKNAIGVSEEKYYSEYKKESGENSRGNESSNISLRDSTTFNSSVSQKAQTVNNKDMQKNKKDNTKYSYAGIGAKTHDVKTLEQAIRLEDIGKATPEEIRQQTGWFKGYDGKWRFELDDSKAAFRKEGDVKLRQNMRYRRLEELSDRYDNLNEAEKKEFDALEKEFEDDIWSEKYELQDYLDYPALYEAYPQLKHISVAFETLEPGVYGEFHRNRNMIILKKGADSSLIKSALLHELQHAVQKIEGFAGGSSPGYWSQVPAERKPGTYAHKITERNKIGDKILDSASQEFIDAFRAYNRGELEYSDLEKIGTEDELDLLFDYDEADREATRLHLNDRSDYNLYMSTAGEIEARDVESRQNLSAEERKNTRPDIDRTDVVFSNDNTVGYSIVEPFIDENGVEFKNAVLLDTDFFDGISTRNWGRKLKEFVTERSKNNPFILPIVDENGNVQNLQFASIRDRVRKQGHSEHKVLDKLWNNTDNAAKLAVIHIDEVISISKEKNPYYTNENNHQWLDANGWLHRTANVINSKNGAVFELTLDIAQANDGRTILYATDGKTKKVGNVQVNSLKIRGSGQNSNFKDNVSQPSADVKEKYSRQLNNTAENIEQLKAENESFAGYIDEVTQELQSKLKNKKLPDVVKIFDRNKLYKIAAKYNTYYEPNKNGGFSKKQYSNTEIADIIENVLTEVSQGKANVQDAVTRLATIQEHVLQNGYAIEYEPGAKKFRKELRNKPIYLTAKDYNQLV